MKELPDTDIVTVPCRLSYPALWTPKPKSQELKGSTDPKDLEYSCVLLLPPETDLAPYKAAIRAAMIGRFGEIVRLKHPLLRRAEEKEGVEGYEPGWIFLTARNKSQVPIVDRKAVPVTNKALVYPGMWVLAYLNAYAWDSKIGGRGVSWGLNGIQIYQDDKPFGNVRQVSDVFEALDLGGDDQLDDLGSDPLDDGSGSGLDYDAPAPPRRGPSRPAARPQARPAAPTRRPAPAAAPAQRGRVQPPQQRRPAPRQETIDDFLGEADGFDELNEL